MESHFQQMKPHTLNTECGVPQGRVLVHTPTYSSGPQPFEVMWLITICAIQFSFGNFCERMGH